MRRNSARILLAAVAIGLATSSTFAAQVSYFPVPRGAHPHDVAPAPDGTVWYTAQTQGALGRLDPKTGKTIQIPLGPAPHGVIIGPDRAGWVTDGGQNAILRVDPADQGVTRFPLPAQFADADLNTATPSNRAHADVHQMLGRPGELWAAESGTDRLVVIRP